MLSNDISRQTRALKKIWSDNYDPGLLVRTALYYHEIYDLRDAFTVDDVVDLFYYADIEDLLSINDDLNSISRVKGNWPRTILTVRGKERAALVGKEQWLQLRAALDARYENVRENEQLLPRQLLELGKEGIDALIEFFESNERIEPESKAQEKRQYEIKNLDYQCETPGLVLVELPLSDDAKDRQAASKWRDVGAAKCKVDALGQRTASTIDVNSGRRPKRRKTTRSTLPLQESATVCPSDSETHMSPAKSDPNTTKDSVQRILSSGSQSKRRRRRRKDCQSSPTTKGPTLVKQALYQDGRHSVQSMSDSPLADTAFPVGYHPSTSVDDPSLSSLLEQRGRDQAKACETPASRACAFTGEESLSVIQAAILEPESGASPGRPRSISCSPLTSSSEALNTDNKSTSAQSSLILNREDPGREPETHHSELCGSILSRDPRNGRRVRKRGRSIVQGKYSKGVTRKKLEEHIIQTKCGPSPPSPVASAEVPDNHVVQPPASSNNDANTTSAEQLNRRKPNSTDHECISAKSKSGEDIDSNNIAASVRENESPLDGLAVRNDEAFTLNKGPLQQGAGVPLETHAVFNEGVHPGEFTSDAPQKPSTRERCKRRTTGTTSSFFKAQSNMKRTKSASPLKMIKNLHSPTKAKRTPHAKTSFIQMPPLTAKSFGLIQETLSDQPLQLIVATILLNKTTGRAAIPTLYQLLETYPTAEALASAPYEDILQIIAQLGLQNSRSSRLIDLGKVWTLDPPTKHRRHRTLNYPKPGDGSDILPNEVAGPEDKDPRRGAWEIAHLPGVGEYATDSWRIFCRDQLRGLADDYRGTAARPTNLGPIHQREGHGAKIETNDLDVPFEPEWKRVLPNDKELRAYLRWMWFKEGIDWNPRSGEKKKATQEQLDRINRGAELVEVTGQAGLVGTAFLQMPDDTGFGTINAHFETEVPASLEAVEHVSSSEKSDLSRHATLMQKVPLLHSRLASDSAGSESPELALDPANWSDDDIQQSSLEHFSGSRTDINPKRDIHSKRRCLRTSSASPEPVQPSDSSACSRYSSDSDLGQGGSSASANRQEGAHAELPTSNFCFEQPAVVSHNYNTSLEATYKVVEKETEPVDAKQPPFPDVRQTPSRLAGHALNASQPKKQRPCGVPVARPKSLASSDSPSPDEKVKLALQSQTRNPLIQHVGSASSQPSPGARSHSPTSPTQHQSNNHISGIAASVDESSSPPPRKFEQQTRPAFLQAHNEGVNESNDEHSESDVYETAPSHSSPVGPSDNIFARTWLDDARITSKSTNPRSRALGKADPSSQNRAKIDISKIVTKDAITDDSSELFPYFDMRSAQSSAQVTDHQHSTYRCSGSTSRQSVSFIASSPSADMLLEHTTVTLQEQVKVINKETWTVGLNEGKPDEADDEAHLASIGAARKLALSAITGLPYYIDNGRTYTHNPSVGNTDSNSAIPQLDHSTQRFAPLTPPSSVAHMPPRRTALSRSTDFKSAAESATGRAQKKPGKLPTVSTSARRNLRQTLPSLRASYAPSTDPRPSLVGRDDNSMKMKAGDHAVLQRRNRDGEGGYLSDASISRDKALMRRAEQQRRRLEATMQGTDQVGGPSGGTTQH